MKLAFGKMQLRPDDFWNMSIGEFFAATEGFSEWHSGGTPPPLGSSELESLMERYPD